MSFELKRLVDKSQSQVHSTEEAISFPWDNPVPLDEIALDPFPLSAFPVWLRDFVDSLAQSTATPVELGAMDSIAIISASVSRVFEVEVKDGYREPVNLWTCVALDVGNRKTPVMNKCREPIEEWERNRLEQMKPRILEAISRRKTEEAYVNALRNRLSHSKSQDEQRQLQAEIIEAEKQYTVIPRAPRIWTSDVTPEKLAAILADNDERIAILSDEGGIFDTLGGRYSKGVANLDIFLKGHAGSADRVQRKNGPDVILHRPALTIGLSPQPSVVRALAESPAFRGRGLLARFLFAMPKSQVGYRDANLPSLNDALKRRYCEAIWELLDFCFPEDAEQLREPIVLKLSERAREFRTAFEQELEPELREEGDLAYIKDWVTKLPGATVRIAGILHIAEHLGDVERIPDICDQTMMKAIAIAQCLIQHAKAAFNLMGADPDLENAKFVLRWIKRTGLYTFTVRDCHHANQRRFEKVALLQQALDVLEERNFIRAWPHEPVPHRPSKRYQVNPAIHGEVGEKAS